MRVRSLNWGRIVFSVLVITLGLVLASEAARSVPPVVRAYWPAVLIVWGIGLLMVRLRSREDLWAGMDYGTGLYVIRHRRRRPGLWLPGLILIVLGVLFLIANLDPTSGIWFGPLVLLALGVIWLISSFGPPPRKDF